MKLRNVLIVVKDIENLKNFIMIYLVWIRYWTMWKCDSDRRARPSGRKIWKSFLEKEVIPENNACELYFEESDIEAFVEKLKSYIRTSNM